MSVSSTSHITSTKGTPLFSGMSYAYDDWKARFLSRAIAKGWVEILMGREKLPEGSDTDLTMVENVVVKLEPGTEGAEAQKKAATVKPLTDEEKETLKKACKAWSEMINAMQSSVCLKLVNNHPSDPHEALLALDRKFGPKTTVDLGNLQQRYTTIELKPGSSTDLFINLLEDLRVKIESMGEVISNRSFLNHVLWKLGPAYADLSQILMPRIDNTTNPLTIDQLKLEVEQYTQMKNIRKKAPIYRKNLESAFYVGDNYKKPTYKKSPKKQCPKCGNYHSQDWNCTSVKDGDKKPAALKFTGECNWCHKKGHKEVDCWAKQKVLQAQVAMVHTTTDEAECAFNAVA